MSQQARKPVLTQATAARIADVFEAKGISPYGWNYDANMAFHHAMNKPEMGTIYARTFESTHSARPEYFDAEVFALVDGLPYGWRGDVFDVLNARQAVKDAAATEARNAVTREHIRNMETSPAIRAYLLSQVGSRGFSAKPEIRKLSGKPAANRTYNPMPGCNARLKLSQSVSFRYTQESYADHSEFAVPVEGNPNSEACRVNLSRLLESWRTHNGFAGSGCTYTASIQGDEANGWFVLIDCRASISD